MTKEEFDKQQWYCGLKLKGFSSFSEFEGVLKTVDFETGVIEIRDNVDNDKSFYYPNVEICERQDFYPNNIKPINP